MTPHFTRNLLIDTISNVTGKPPEVIAALEKVMLDTRDWEQVFSRLEATLDIQTGMLTLSERSILIDEATSLMHAGLTSKAHHTEQV